MKEFLGIITGDIPDRYGWLYPVNARVPQTAAVSSVSEIER